MSKRPGLIIPAVVVGILLVIIAVIYWVSAARALPSFFPGYQAGSPHHHVKHGIAAAILALGAFAYAWFQSGPRQAR